MAAKGSGKGRYERRSSPAGRVQQPDLRRYYRHKLPAYDPEDFEARIRVIRGNAPALDVEDVTEGLEWSDEAGALQGSVTLRRPDPEDPNSLPVGRGHRLRLSVRWAGQWYRLWEMRCLPPERDFSGAVSVGLVDEMDAARRSEKDRLYRKDRAHPRGWRMDQIIRDAAKKDGIRLGKVAKGTVHIRRLRLRKGSFVETVQKAVREEREETGRRFVLRFRDGRFDVIPYQRNRVVFRFDESAVLEGSVTRVGSAKPITVVTGVGRIGKGKDARKVRYTHYDRSVVERYGYMHRVKRYGRVSSQAALRARVKRTLARALRTRITASVTVPFTPFIRRGDPVWVDLRREGLAEADSFLFVTSVRHDLGSTSRTTQLELTEQDPFLRYQEQRERDQRAKKRRERERRRR